MSLKYYTHLINTAAGRGKRVAILGQGIGPIQTFFGKRAASRALSQCDLITTRDEASMETIESLAPNIKARKAVADDLAWLAIEPNYNVEKKKAVAVSARPWKDATPKIIKTFKGFCSRAALDGWEIVPISFDREMDDEVLKPIRDKSARAESPKAVLKLMAPVQHTVAMRLHAGIFSSGLNIPATMVAYDSKVGTFAESIGSEALTLENLTEEHLWETFQRDTQDEALREAVEERAHKGAVNAKVSIDLLEEVLAGVPESAD
jgi:polysaccharide pyruvyl transferase WcaK-like protein